MMKQAGGPANLRHGALGPGSVLLQAIATAGPAAGLATSLVFVATYAGGSAPLAVLLGSIGILFVALSMAQLARHVPSAGGMYSYAAAGLGSGAGFLTAWAVMLAEWVNVPVIVLGAAYITQADLTTHLHTPTWLWAPVGIALTAVATFLTYRGIRLSARIVSILGVAELVVIVALIFTLIISAGGRNTLSVFGTHVGNAHGFGSDFAAMIYCVLAFVGFDAAAPLAEEAQNPRRAVSRALVGSVLLTGIVFVLATYAAVVYWGPHAIATGTHSFVAFNGGDPFDGVAQKVWGGAWVIMLLAVLNSLYAGSVGGMNASTRYQFALGRIRILPTSFGIVHPKHLTPWVAVGVQGTITVVLVVGLSLGLGSASAAFGFLASGVVLLFLLIYGIASISCIGFYWRYHRHGFNVVAHGIIPVLAVAFLAPVFVASLGINFAGLGIAPLAGASKWAPWFAGAWMLAGVILLPILRRRWAPRFAQLDRVFLSPKEAVAESALTPPSSASVAMVE
jgi:amino acid transporter